LLPVSLRFYIVRILLIATTKHCQAMNFRGLYALDSQSLLKDAQEISQACAHKLCGVGPSVLRPPMCAQLFKYNSASRTFGPLDARSFTVTTDAAALDRAYFKKKRAVAGGRAGGNSGR
jgi:hypothetical protein